MRVPIWQRSAQSMSRLLGGSPESSSGCAFRERYWMPKELPPRLLKVVRKLVAVERYQSRRTLIRKLDAIEGNYLSRYAPPAEPRSGPSDDDWSLCT
jgi:hypothetical protein